MTQCKCKQKQYKLKKKEVTTMEEYEKCAWCGEECEKSELVKETHMGYLCEYCVRALESRGEHLCIEIN